MKKRSITILYNSPVILTFALLSLFALGLGKLTDGWTTQNLFCVYRSSLTDWLTYPRFFPCTCSAIRTSPPIAATS